AGTPVVQPSVGPYPEIVQGTGGGTLFGDPTPTALAAALRHLLQHPERLRDFGAAGRAAVRERHTDVAMARGTVEAIRLLAKGAA
ncbi:MAG: glycosyltransferase, partial [Verrucomicrobiota bacterium]